jgi:MoxR-like ATPase
MLVARARAVIAGRDFVTPDDVKAVGPAVLAHRISLNAQAWATGVNPRDVITGIVAEVPGPPPVGVRA